MKQNEEWSTEKREKVTWLGGRGVRFGDGRRRHKRKRSIDGERRGGGGTGDGLNDLRSESVRAAYQRGEKTTEEIRQEKKKKKKTGISSDSWSRDEPETESTSSDVWASRGRRCCETGTEGGEEEWWRKRGRRENDVRVKGEQQSFTTEEIYIWTVTRSESGCCPTISRVKVIRLLMQNQ